MVVTNDSCCVNLGSASPSVGVVLKLRESELCSAVQFAAAVVGTNCLGEFSFIIPTIAPHKIHINWSRHVSVKLYHSYNYKYANGVLIYVPCILYSLLSRPTNAQHTCINNILCIS